MCYIASFSTSLSAFLWLVWGNGVLDEFALVPHSPYPSGSVPPPLAQPLPLLWKGCSAEVSLCFSWCGMWWIKAGWEQRASSFQLFSSARIFFFPSKDDASFQGVFNLQTVSSVYFSAVKCVPLRSDLSPFKIQPVLFSVASCHSKEQMCFIKSL